MDFRCLLCQRQLSFLVQSLHRLHLSLSHIDFRNCLRVWQTSKSGLLHIAMEESKTCHYLIQCNPRSRSAMTSNNASSMFFNSRMLIFFHAHSNSHVVPVYGGYGLTKEGLQGGATANSSKLLRKRYLRTLTLSLLGSPVSHNSLLSNSLLWFRSLVSTAVFSRC